jgi:hypothetical protein
VMPSVKMPALFRCNASSNLRIRDPNDNQMVVMFADHCERQFNAFKHSIANRNR